ncbi:hypothetical protein ACJJTC_010095 [Scirpophaga incertulas]
MLFRVCLLPVTFLIIVKANDKATYFVNNNEPESDLVSLILSKNYVPNENYLPRPFVLKKTDNDITYLLSKLSNEELLKLLGEQPKHSKYDLNDIFTLSINSKDDDSHVSTKKYKNTLNTNFEFLSDYENKSEDNKRFRTIPVKDKSDQTPIFRLENKPVIAYSTTDEKDLNYDVSLKLNELLNSHQLPLTKNIVNDDLDDERKEVIFDMLVDQLKNLCFKRTPQTKHTVNKQSINNILNLMSGNIETQNPAIMNEHIFLILNDEIKTNSSDDLISVDPDSLERNSSVLLLGPITTPLTDNQLKIVMARISNELSKPEYIPLLHELSKGTVSSGNVSLIKSLVTGLDTRRYIKPHRCNHQSKLSRVYGGPKWLICTGYLNLNNPSLYD